MVSSGSIAIIDSDQPRHGHVNKPRTLSDGIATSSAFGLGDLRNQWSRFVCNSCFYPSLDDHLSRDPNTTHPEKWLAVIVLSVQSTLSNIFVSLYCSEDRFAYDSRITNIAALQPKRTDFHRLQETEELAFLTRGTVFR